MSLNFWLTGKIGGSSSTHLYSPDHPPKEWVMIYNKYNLVKHFVSIRPSFWITIAISFYENSVLLKIISSKYRFSNLKACEVRWKVYNSPKTL